MIFTGCGNNLFDKAVDQGKLAVEDQNYGKAKASFELALQEKDDSHTRNMLQQVDYMLLGLQAKDDFNPEEAIRYFTKVINEESDRIFVSMQEEARQLKIQLQALQDKINEYEESILKASNMLKEKNYSESKKILNEIVENTKEQVEFLAQHKKAQETLDLVHSAVTQLEIQQQEEKALLAAQEAIKNPIGPKVKIEIVASSNGYGLGEYKMMDMNKDGVKDYVAIVTKLANSYLMVMDGSTGDILATNEIYPGSYGNSFDIYSVQGNYHILETCNDLYPSYSIYQWKDGKLIQDKNALYHDFEITLGETNVLQVRYQSPKYSQKFSIPGEAYMELAFDGELNWYSTTEAIIKNDVLIHTHFITLTSPHEYEPLIMTEKSIWNDNKWILDQVEYTTLEYDFYSDKGKFKEIN